MTARESLHNSIRNAQEWLRDSRRRLATWGVGVLACVVAYHVLFGANGLVVYGQKRSESKQVQEQLENLKRQNEQITQRIRALKSDPKAIEREAREKLKYVRPGEMVYTLPVQPEPADPANRK
jgi:cell division protein FtsB